MGQERFKRLGENSFFGRMVYDRVVPRDHFLMRLGEIIPWQRFTYKLVKYYRGGAKEGRPPYDPAVLLKMLLVAFLYNLSERQVEEVANFNLAVKCFLGLAADELAPDHSTLTAFKGRIVENGRLAAYEKLGSKPDMGKSCVRFGKLEDLPLEAVAKLVAGIGVEDYLAHSEKSRAARR